MVLSIAEAMELSLGHLDYLKENLLGADTGFFSIGKAEISRTLSLQTYILKQSFKGGVAPTVYTIFEINRDVVRILLKAIRKKKPLAACLRELSDRFLSGLRYTSLINTLGRELFGSAIYPGETRLAENDLMTLSYLPPRPDTAVRQPAIFHAGGFLPFADKIFRILPEANLFLPFTGRGFPVYAMELKGDRTQIPDLGRCTLERLIDIIDEMSEVAFEHNGQEKMILECYCGLAMPVMAYIAARPQDADRKFKVVFSLAAPIDASKCGMVGELITRIPLNLLLTHLVLADLFGGYLHGSQIRAGIDLPLNTAFIKSELGRFLIGWKQKVYSHVRRVEELNEAQRKEMAGAYWISPQNCDRYPIPLDLARFFTVLWQRGVSGDWRIPYTYRGKPLSFETIREETALKVAGFYGGKDPVVPEKTAHVLKSVLGDRYTHVVHPTAGHISYVLSSEIWDPQHRKALDPNPLDVVRELYGS